MGLMHYNLAKSPKMAGEEDPSISNRQRYGSMEDVHQEDRSSRTMKVRGINAMCSLPPSVSVEYDDIQGIRNWPILVPGGSGQQTSLSRSMDLRVASKE